MKEKEKDTGFEHRLFGYAGLGKSEIIQRWAANYKLIDALNKSIDEAFLEVIETHTEPDEVEERNEDNT